MASTQLARALALGLPEAEEQSHHGFPSFRVAGKIFATLPDPDHMNVMLDEDDAAEVVREHSAACSEQWWGKRLVGVHVSLSAIEADTLELLLMDAWRRRAPRRLQGG